MYRLVISEKNKNVFIKSLDMTGLGQDTLVSLGKIRVEEEYKTLQEIIVKGRKPILVRKIDRLEFDVSNSVLSSGYNALEVLSKLPGVMVDNSGNVAVNGKGDIYLLIDGRGQRISKEQAQAILSNLRSENIERIHIITNPSAKYDAQGSAVIDVITKRDKMKSDVHATYGNQLYPVSNVNGFEFPYASGGFNINYGKSRLKTFASFDLTKTQEYRNSTESKLILFNTNLQRISRSLDLYKETTVNGRAGFNFDINKKHNLDVVYSNFSSPFKKYSTTTRNEYSNTNTKAIDSVYSTEGELDNSDVYISSLSLKYLFKIDGKGKNLSVLLDNTKNRNPNHSFSNGLIYYPSANYKSDEFLFARDYRVNFYSANIDYEQPLNQNLLLETGVKLTIIKNNDLSSSLVNKFGSYPSSVNTTSDFDYRETIEGAYINIRKAYKKLTWQLGARGENTQSEGKNVYSVETISRKYFNFFPSGALLFNFKEASQLSASYSTRISRPSYAFFNPNHIYSNIYSITQGNANLRAQILNSFELSYLYKGYYASLSLTRASNPKIDLPGQNQNSGITITRYVTNLKATHTYNFNMNIPLRITSWWQGYSNIGILNNRAVLLNNENVSSWFFSFNTNQSLTIHKKNKVEFNFNYSSGSRFAYSITMPNQNFSIGYRRSITDKLNLTLNVNDVFGINKFKLENNYGYLYDEMRSLKNSRFFRLSLLYQFNTGNRFAIRSSSSKGSFGEKRF
jgi:hypothetical protein